MKFSGGRWGWRKWGINFVNLWDRVISKIIIIIEGKEGRHFWELGLPCRPVTLFLEILFSWFTEIGVFQFTTRGYRSLTTWSKCLRNCKKYFELSHRSSSCWNSTEKTAEKEFFISVKAFTCRKHRWIPVRFLCLFPFHTHNTGTWLSLLENYYLIGTHYASYHFIRFWCIWINLKILTVLSRRLALETSPCPFSSKWFHSSVKKNSL